MVTQPARSTPLAVVRRDVSARSGAYAGHRGPVVLATAGQSHNGAAVVTAQRLADQLHVPLEVVCVVESTAPGAPAIHRFGPHGCEIDDVQRHAAATTASDYVTRFGGGAAPPRVHVRCGGVATEISRFARDVSATVIVMGADADAGARDASSSGPAAQVVRSAHCPVMAVPSSDADAPR